MSNKGSAVSNVSSIFKDLSVAGIRRECGREWGHDCCNDGRYVVSHPLSLSRSLSLFFSLSPCSLSVCRSVFLLSLSLSPSLLSFSLPLSTLLSLSLSLLSSVVFFFIFFMMTSDQLSNYLALRPLLWRLRLLFAARFRAKSPTLETVRTQSPQTGSDPSTSEEGTTCLPPCFGETTCCLRNNSERGDY